MLNNKGEVIKDVRYYDVQEDYEYGASRLNSFDYIKEVIESGWYEAGYNILLPNDESEYLDQFDN